MAIIRAAVAADTAALSDLAARTFPLACPPSTPIEAITRHVATQLDTEHFAAWIAGSAHHVVVADSGQDLVAYALISAHFLGPDIAERHAHPWSGQGIELSKLYVDSDHHGRGIGDEVMVAALAAGATFDSEAPIWLGTSASNLRAQAFYRRHGFVERGVRKYFVGGRWEDDVVMVRSPAPART